jgi:hypothetical protein
VVKVYWCHAGDHQRIAEPDDRNDFCATSPVEVATLAEEPRQRVMIDISSSPKNSWRDKVKHFSGLDRAIVFTVLARGCQILGSGGTVFLIVHFLTPAEQGYYYTLYGLVSLQVVFELGFSFVILQMAAHESAYVTLLSDGTIEGDSIAHKRLASILQKVRRWYTVAAFSMFVTLAPSGWYFFLQHQRPGDSVEWKLPWTLLVLMAALLLQVDPIFSFLEGCGQIREVALLRMEQVVVGVAFGWTAIISGHGMYSPAVTLSGQFLTGVLFLWARRKFLLCLLRKDTEEDDIAWAREVWPFQWKIAVSWICNWFSAQMLVVILFTYCGAVAAGKMGMSMSIVGSLSGIAFAWMSTKSAIFGSMVQRREESLLDRLFFRALLQSTVLICIGAIVMLAGLSALERYLPSLGARTISVPLFAVLAVTALSSNIVQSEALYLRAHKCEPFLLQSILLAALVSGSALLLARKYGVTGIVWGYFVCMGLIALASGTVIFRKKRQAWGYIS